MEPIGNYKYLMYIKGGVVLNIVGHLNEKLDNYENIIRKAIEGDTDSFMTLIDENITSYYRVAKGILSSEEDIKDAIQNTIIVVYNKLHTLKNVKLFKTWSIRILINQCNKIYNTNKKLIKIEKVKSISTDAVDVDSKIDLYNAISTLPNKLKIPTILFYFDDLSYKDISKILSIPEGTIKSRIFRAREKLYEILKEV